MNFENMTTEDLRRILPPAENGWEFKDASLLLKTNRNDLKKELEIQTSAFANTGGGYLVFGIEKTTNDFQPCEQFEGREPMEEFLATKIRQAVEYPLIDAKVYRIPFTSDAAKSIFLVQYPDSAKAPHQAKTDKKYYWRTNFTSEPAPHFHLELLRNRFTRAVLTITGTRFLVDVPFYMEIAEADFAGHPVYKSALTLDVFVEVTNTSLSCAEVWGVHATIVGTQDWFTDKDGYGPSGLFRSDVAQLLPDDKQQVRVRVTSLIKGPNHYQQMFALFEQLRIELRPVSQNYVGEPSYFEYPTDSELRELVKQTFAQQVHGFAVRPVT